MNRVQRGACALTWQVQTDQPMHYAVTVSDRVQVWQGDIVDSATVRVDPAPLVARVVWRLENPNFIVVGDTTWVCQ